MYSGMSLGRHYNSGIGTHEYIYRPARSTTWHVWFHVIWFVFLYEEWNCGHVDRRTSGTFISIFKLQLSHKCSCSHLLSLLLLVIPSWREVEIPNGHPLYLTHCQEGWQAAGEWSWKSGLSPCGNVPTQKNLKQENKSTSNKISFTLFLYAWLGTHHNPRERRQ